MANFEFLIEDQSGKRAMSVLIPKILGSGASYNIHSYRGIGHIPKGLTPRADAGKQFLLDQLPRLLKGYGNNPECGAVVVICDLDGRDKKQFLSELNGVLAACDPQPHTLFCLAVEEMEAWYLGDLDAIRKSYPNAKYSVLKSYVNDSICGTWELLADAVHKGGSKDLIKRGWRETGRLKSEWAEKISPNMDIKNNKSPSFNHMLSQLRNSNRKYRNI